ncbi:ATP-binding cassette domain-containing protein [Devosia sp. D6-9]|nr:ATP-binding cassette domain-containing protein [Devosia sp. D6-9]
MVGRHHARFRHRHRQPRLLLPRRRPARRARSQARRTPVTNLLEVRNLRVTFPSARGPVEVVKGISFSLGRERLGIVGESGSGKSMTGRSILKLIRSPGKVTADLLDFDGLDLLRQNDKQMRAIRGARISMIMQDPKFSLNPVMTIGAQIAEALLTHQRLGRGDIRQRVHTMLESVRIADPARVAKLYPHEVSGGMGQRVMIAMMLIPEPDLLIADEPTSALDVSVQAQVLDIIDDLVKRKGMGLIFISHDLNLVSSYCDRILVMYAGTVVEECVASELQHAKHPYTQGLLAAIPRLDEDRAELPVLDRSGWAA